MSQLHFLILSFNLQDENKDGLHDMFWEVTSLAFDIKVGTEYQCIEFMASPLLLPQPRPETDNDVTGNHAIIWS